MSDSTEEVKLDFEAFIVRVKLLIEKLVWKKT